MDSDEEAGPSKRRLTTFCELWKVIPEYAKWIRKKDNYTAECKLCQTDILIKYEGSRSLNKHIKTKKHIKMEMSQKISQTISKFVVPVGTKIETQIARAELVCVYHNVLHGLSYNSLDCQIKLSSVLYCDSKIANKITCGRTKAAAIARNVLAPFSQQVTVDALKKNYYFSVSSDASNIGNVKTYPYAVQFFDTEYGIRKLVLDFYNDPYETSKDIFSNIIRITNDCDLEIQQISSYSADNAAVNYGIHNSVYQKLKDTSDQIVKANCNCHILNNCVKRALNSLSVDIESIIIKIFNEFSSSAMTTEKLKECFAFAGIEYKELLRHIATRWLSLLPAVDRLIFCWPAVKMYFLKKGQNKCQKVLWEFISYGTSANDVNDEDECKTEGLSEAYLYFIHNIMQEFHTTILALESDSCTVLEMHDIMSRLMNNLQCRLNDKFFGSKVITILKNLSNNEQQMFIKEAEDFLKTAVSYLENRYDFGDDSFFKKVAFLNLKKNLFSWEELQELPKVLKIDKAIDNDKLYSDFCSLRKVYEQLPKDLSNDKIWANFFYKSDENEFENLRKVVCFVFSIPVSNAFCERVFSILNNLYTKERNRMAFDIIKAEILIRSNLEKSCKDFQQFLQTPKGTELANSVSSNSKYMWQKK